MSHPILATKLFIPSPRQELVNRPRLTHTLTEGIGKKLTLVSAPAGFGKTTLVLDWLSSLDQAVQVAWVSLDEKDNLPSRLLTYLIAAFQQVEPELGQEAWRLLETVEMEEDEAALVSLLNDLGSLTDSIVIVLDDFQVLEAPTVLELFDFLIDNLPAMIHLVLLTREDPILPLARLRAEGQLVELRAADLRFNREEAARFLNRVMELDIDPEGLEALEERTEGWIVGLQLAGLSLQGQGDIPGLIEEFTGSNRLVLDYLMEEVLSKQDPAVTSFLMDTCLLESLTGDLCDALTGNRDGAEMLDHLERANLFLVPLDSSRAWFRYHRLFRDLLFQRLRMGNADRVADLHRKASHWYRGQGMLEDAVDQALLAKDFPYAGELILEFLDNSLWVMEQDLLEIWLSRIPEETISKVSMLCILKAALALNSGHPEQAEGVLQGCGFDFDQYLDGGQVREDPASGLDPASRNLLGRAAVVKAHLVSFRGDNPLSYQYSTLALKLLSEADTIWRWYALDSLGSSFAGREESRAFQARSEAVEESKRTSYPSLKLLSNLRLVVTLRDIGYLQQASEVLSGSRRLAQESGLDSTAIAGWMFSLGGELLAEKNQLDDALEYARQGLDLTSRGSEVIYLGSSYLCLLRVLFSRSEYQDLRDTVQDIRHFNLSQDFSPWIINQLTAWQARSLIQEGELGFARNWLESMGFDPLGEYHQTHDFDYSVIARLYLAQGDYQDSARLLEHYSQQISSGNRISKMIEIQTLQALTAEAAGNRSQAFAFLESGLRSALPGRYLRTFLDEGPALIKLLELYQPAEEGLREYCQDLLASAAGPARKEIQAASQALVEPLTDRELEVLQLIAAGNTNPEIAALLYLTQNTVKVHTRNIYGKLGVNNRTRAAAVGRDMGLVAV